MADRSPVFDFLDDDGCVIPLVPSRKYPSGMNYTIPSPEAESGMRFAALADIGLKVRRGIPVSDSDKAKLRFSDGEEHEFAQEVLGPVYQQMIDDGVSWVRMQRITQYAYTYFALGPDAANEAAERGVFEGKSQARPTSTQGRAGQSDRPGSTATNRRRRRR
jgi:hypothetical protein